MAVKTLLDIVKEVCYRINEPAPSSLVASTDPNNLQWLHLLYEVGDDIVSRCDYPSLKRKYRFDTVVDQLQYELPGDYWRLTMNTQWDESNDWALFGPEDDGSAVGRELGIVPYGTQFSFRILGAPFQTGGGHASWDFGGPNFEVVPTPAAVRNLYIEYITSNWFMPEVIAANTAYSTGDFFSSRGNIYEVASGGTTAIVGFTYPTDESGTSGTVDYQLWRGKYNVPEADTDFPIIDPLVLMHGLRAAWLRSQGLEDSRFQQLFEDRLAEVVGRYEGSSEINGDGPILYDFPNLSDDFLSPGW